MAWEPDYATQDQLRDFAHTSDADDPWLDLARSSASRALDTFTHRQFGVLDAPQARLYSARWSRTRCGWIVETADLMTLVGLAVAFDSAGDGTYATTVDVAKLVWLPFDAAERNRPWERVLLRPSAGTFSDLRGGFRITARWGWLPTWPATVTEMTLLQGSRFLMRRDSPYGVVGNPENGSEKRLLAKLDPDVQLQVRTLRRETWAR